MVNKKFNGNRMKNARLFRGKTLTELASMTGISKQSLSLYENDSNNPDYERVIQIANALKIPYEYFLKEESIRTTTEVTYFRSLANTTKMSRTSQNTKLEFVAKMYEALSEYVDFPELNIPSIDFNEMQIGQCVEENVNLIETIAQSVRKHWGLGNEPIPNLQLILEENGLIVTGFDFDDKKIDAFSQRTEIDDAYVYFIAVTQGVKPEGRIRFDMAHELGHILLHPWSESLDLITKEEFKLREIQANMFASALLLPKESFIQDVKAYPTDLKYYQYLKKKWKSSIQSMVYRSHQLGVITSNQYQYIMRQISRNGWRIKEPYDEPYFLNDNIFQVAIDLLINQNILSSIEIVKLFNNYDVNLYVDDIEKLLNLRKGTLYRMPNKANIIQLKKIEREKDK